MLGFTLDLQSDRKLFKSFLNYILGNLQLPQFSLPLCEVAKTERKDRRQQICICVYVCIRSARILPISW